MCSDELKVYVTSWMKIVYNGDNNSVMCSDELKVCDMDENEHCLLCQKDLSEQLEYNADKHIASCKRKYDKKKQDEEINEKRKRKNEKGSLFG